MKAKLFNFDKLSIAPHEKLRIFGGLRINCFSKVLEKLIERVEIILLMSFFFIIFFRIFVRKKKHKL